MRRILVPVAALLLIAGATTTTHAYQTQQQEFSGVSRINGDGVSGDIIIKPAEGRQVRVELFEDVTPAENFEGEIRQSGSTLSIEEHWRGRNSRELSCPSCKRETASSLDSPWISGGKARPTRLSAIGAGVRLRQRRTSQAIMAAINGAARAAIIRSFGFLFANARC